MEFEIANVFIDSIYLIIITLINKQINGYFVLFVIIKKIVDNLS